jgi:hypothetical protein
LTVQSSVFVDASTSFPICGNATVSPKKSSVRMIITPDIATTTHHLRFAAVIAGIAGDYAGPHSCPAPVDGRLERRLDASAARARH